ncbi:MAG TPA: hypothetical protein VGM02_13465 [Acidobacteriaceae bacterium]|jgi:hypothetical protein
MTYESSLEWSDIPRIYKARLRQLGRSMAINVAAGIILVAIFILIPLYFGIALFSGRGHYILTALAFGVALMIAGRLYWNSFRMAGKPRG